MVKHTQTICWLLSTNWLSTFDHPVGLALKELRVFPGNFAKHFITVFREITVNSYLR